MANVSVKELRGSMANAFFPSTGNMNEITDFYNKIIYSFLKVHISNSGPLVLFIYRSCFVVILRELSYFDHLDKNLV